MRISTAERWMHFGAGLAAGIAIGVSFVFIGIALGWFTV